jgi:flagellar hook-associated protein 1 FlgK
MASGSQFGQSRRVIDALSNRSVRTAQAEIGFHNGRRTALETIEAIVAPEGDGLASAMDGFFNSFNRLSTNPGGTTERRSVVDQAQRFVDELHNTYEQLDGLRKPLANAARDKVSTINELSAQVAEINGTLAATEAGGVEASQLRDDRDMALDQLASMTGGRIIEHQDGTVSVTMRGGASLVSGDRSSTLEVSEADGQLQLTLQGPENGPKVDIETSNAGGELSGIFKAHNEDVGQAMAALDSLAMNFATAFNEVHEQGVGLDGQAGRPFFSGVDDPNSAARNISINADIVDDPGAIAATRDPNALPGGSELAVELAGLREQPIDGLDGLTVEGALGQIQIGAGQKIDETYDRLDSAEAKGSVFEGIRESTRGVSLDEELADLMKFQRGFEAASRIVKSADELMQTVLSLV